MILLVDGDMLIYKVAYAIERVVEWPNDVVTAYADKQLGRQMVQAQLHRYMERTKASGVLMCLTDRNKPCFRKDIDPTYKGHRVDKPKPVAYGFLLHMLKTEFEFKILEALEADDVMGITQTQRGGDTCIVSDDKDMLQIPGRLYRPTTDEYRTVSEAQGRKAHLLQALMGDAVDGYYGCPKVGPVRAAAILMEEGDEWTNIVKAYEKAGLTEEDALVQARLAKILDADHWSLGKPVLWEPN